MTEGSIQLSGGLGPFEGRVEIYILGHWSIVYPSSWDMKDAAVVCHQLGYNGALAALFDNHFNGPKENRSYAINSIGCTGYEANITHCANAFPLPRNQPGVAEVICKVNG